VTNIEWSNYLFTTIENPKRSCRNMICYYIDMTLKLNIRSFHDGERCGDSFTKSQIKNRFDTRKYDFCSASISKTLCHSPWLL